MSWNRKQSSEEGGIRPPVVAGKFYPADPRVLRTAVEKFLADAAPVQVKDVVALVAPHAGYIYSGQIAADAFRQAAGGGYELVVLLGTNHTRPNYRQIGLHPGAGFRTPLGVAAVDQEAVSALIAADPECVRDTTVHEREHSVEVQVPFVQVLFPEAKIVPAVVGEADPGLCRRFGEALGVVLRDRRALVVASSDLSHYPAAAEAERVDPAVLEAIAGLDPARVRERIRAEMARRVPDLHTCACGEGPILVAMTAATALGAGTGRVVSYAHSGQVAVGDRNRVVGYGAVAFGKGVVEMDAKPQAAAAEGGGLSVEDKKALLALARETITRLLTAQTVPLARGLSPRLDERRGVFVTLKKRGRLRGCIGRMVGDMPLGQLVGTMAVQSAFHDSRFDELRAEELKDVEIEISVLTPMTPVRGPEEIVVGRDGVLIRKGRHSAVFLPQVATEQGWGRDEMLDNLAMKAGLSPGAWRQGTEFLTFQAEVFGEAEFGGPTSA